MKRSIHFTDNNYPNLQSIVRAKRIDNPGVKLKGNNVNNHANAIMLQHFNNTELSITSMNVGEQIAVTEIDYDTIISMRNQLKRDGKGEWQTINMGDGQFIVRRTK